MEDVKKPEIASENTPVVSTEQTTSPFFYRKRNWKKRALIYFVIGLIIYAGIYYFVLAKKTTIPYSNNYPTPTQTDQSIPPTTETSNWNTYTNSKMNISFQYPSEWKSNEYDMEVSTGNYNRVVTGDDRKYGFGVSLSIGSPSRYVTDPEKIIKDYLDYYLSSSSQFLTGGKITNKEDIEVGGYKATKYVVQESNNPKSAGGNYTRAWIFIPNNNRVTLVYEEPYEESYDVQIMDQILSTFKFTQ